MSRREQVRSLRTDTTAKSNTASTLAEIRAAAAASAWPSRGLAIRAGILATSPAMSTPLLRIADGHYLRAARLWLQVAYYLDDSEQLAAALRLAARCAAIGGNASFARNCNKRAEAAERQAHLHAPVRAAAAS